MQGYSVHKIAKYMIYLFLLYVFWFQYVFGARNSILYSTTFLAAACMLYDLLISHKSLKDLFPTGVLINLIMCIYSLAFGILVAMNQELLFSAVKTYVAFSLVCLVVCYIIKEENSIDWLIRIIIAIDILCAFYIIFKGYDKPGYGYVLGSEHNPNTLGMVMDLGLFCLAYQSQKNKKKTVLYAGLAILFLYTIINCGSRKGLIAAVIICFIWVFQQSRKTWHDGRWITRILLVILIIAIIFLIVYYYQNIYTKTDSFHRMEKLGDDSEFSSRNRMLYYQYALDYLQEHPLFGIGLQQFSVWNPYHQYAHSTYAEAVADWGTIGSLIYFIPVIWAVIKLLQMLRSKHNREKTQMLLALWIMEIFLGIGQIWFYNIGHMIAWTIVFIYIDMNYDKGSNMERQYKYVKA